MKDRYTKEELLKMARSVAQHAKEVQNTDHLWSEEHWRRISRAIEKIEEIYGVKNER